MTARKAGYRISAAPGPPAGFSLVPDFAGGFAKLRLAAQPSCRQLDMEPSLLPILLLACAGVALALGMMAAARVLAPRRSGPVKQMPYESGMDPEHDTRRRFDVRFHVVAIAFLVFDVELLFLYPWAVANKHPEGFRSLDGFRPTLMFGEVLLFVALLTAAFVYAWRKGVFRWR